LLHWRGGADLAAFFEAAQGLIEAGKILRFGVSNFDLGDMEDAFETRTGEAVAANQVLYNLESRAADWALLDWCRSRSIPIMAYTPLGQGDLLDHPVLNDIAAGHGASPAQVALAWLLGRPGVMTIPKASNEAHVSENAAALDITLNEADLTALDVAFPAPRAPVGIGML
jgi:diketogulonate reductase-like aldo/keto reductase